MTCKDCGGHAPQGQKYCGGKGCKASEAEKRRVAGVDGKKANRDDAKDTLQGQGKIKYVSSSLLCEPSRGPMQLQLTFDEK